MNTLSKMEPCCRDGYDCYKWLNGECKGEDYSKYKNMKSRLPKDIEQFRIMKVGSKKYGAKDVIVSESDFDELSQFAWFIWGNGYTFYCKRMDYKTRKRIPMHRQILGVIDSKIHIDHIDGNGLNNMRSNLRECTNSENQRNSRSRINSTSKYRGVSWDRIKGKWVSQIKDLKKRHIGYFDNEIDAALAYNKEAEKHFGEFARLNKLPINEIG